MPSYTRFPPYIIAAGLLFLITFYHVFNVRNKNTELERKARVYSEALAVSKEKNKVLVKDALEKIDKKDAEIKRLEEENLSKHTALGRANGQRAEIEKKLELKNEEIKQLHLLAADHKDEINALSQTVSKSKQVLIKLSEKADHLMLGHKKLKNENIRLQKQNEKLQNDLNQQKSEKRILDDRLSVLTKRKQDLQAQVEDLAKKNRLIQETIKQKIKESYAARRKMTAPIQTTTMKKIEDEQHKVKTLQNQNDKVSTEIHKSTTDVSKVGADVPKVATDEPKVSTDEPKVATDEPIVATVISKAATAEPIVTTDVPIVSKKSSTEYPRNQASKILVNNSTVTPKNQVLKVLVNNSEVMQNEVTRTTQSSSVYNQKMSRILVDNSENRVKRQTISDRFVPETTTEKSNALGDEAPTSNLDEILPVEMITDKPSDSLNENRPQGERSLTDETAMDFQPEMVTATKSSDIGVEQQENSRNFEQEAADDGEMNRETPRNEQMEGNLPTTRNNEELPTFTNNEDETIDKTVEHLPAKVYEEWMQQDNLQGNN